MDANDDSKAAGLYEVATYTDARADLGTRITADAGVVNYYTSATASAADGTLDVSGDGYLLEDDAKLVTIDLTTATVKAVAASGVEQAITDGFTTVYVIESSATDTDVALVYMVK